VFFGLVELANLSKKITQLASIIEKKSPKHNPSPIPNHNLQQGTVHTCLLIMKSLLFAEVLVSKKCLWANTGTVVLLAGLKQWRKG
jgi:hypothetical protein